MTRRRVEGGFRAGEALRAEGASGVGEALGIRWEACIDRREADIVHRVACGVRQEGVLRVVHTRWVPLLVVRILAAACMALEEHRVEERNTLMMEALGAHHTLMEEALEVHRSLDSVHNQMEVLLVRLVVEGSLGWGSRLAVVSSFLA